VNQIFVDCFWLKNNREAKYQHFTGKIVKINNELTDLIGMAETVKPYTPKVVIRSTEYERERFMDRVTQEAWDALHLKGNACNECGPRCGEATVKVVKKLIVKWKLSETFIFGGSFMAEQFWRFRESQICLKNSRAEAREQGLYSKMTVSDQCRHYVHLVKITDEAEYCSKESFIKLLKAILNDDSQRISLGNGFFVLTQFDHSFRMNFSLISIVALENCSGQDEVFFEYENSLAIGIKL
jgi:hypothetical protein